MEKKLRSQKLKKYALIAVWVLVAVGLIAGITLSGRDSGPGDAAAPADNGSQVVQEQTEDQTSNDSEEATVSDEVIEEGEDTEEPADEPEETGDEETQEDASAEEESTEPEQEEETTEVVVEEETEEDSITVSIQILCYTLSNDMSQLENEAIAKYIPANGVMLGKTEYIAAKGETVYDALSAVCKNYGIQLDANYKSSYGSVYVEGIGYLYEFDAGPKSGWMYSVNGSFPNYGCSSYTLSDGDEIKWLYTCKGVGADL